MSDRGRKRKQEETNAAGLGIGGTKFRRGTTNPDRAFDRRLRERSFFSLDGEEFTRRKRLVDLDGNTYALPQPEDRLLARYRISHEVEDIDQTGWPREGTKVTVDGVEGTHLGKALLYVRKKRGRELVRVPRGELQLLDTETLRYYTARVDLAMFHSASKSGHMIVSDLTHFGTIADPSKFSRRA